MSVRCGSAKEIKFSCTVGIWSSTVLEWLKVVWLLNGPVFRLPFEYWTGVVYFNQPTGAVHSIHRSKYCIFAILPCFPLFCKFSLHFSQQMQCTTPICWLKVIFYFLIAEELKWIKRLANLKPQWVQSKKLQFATPSCIHCPILFKFTFWF